MQADSLLSEQARKLKNAGVGIPFLLQGILLTQELNWYLLGFLDSSVGKKKKKNSTRNEVDPGLIPGSGISHGEGIRYPLQYSWASLVFQFVKNPSAMQKTLGRFLGWEDPLESG